MKKCIKCGILKTEYEFQKRGGENYLRTECKECNYKLARTRKKLKELHGSPPCDYRCPICDRDAMQALGEGSRKGSSFVIDHCHKTDSFRGWLCHKCNRGLGTFNDSIDMLKKAIKYLEKGKQNG